MIILTESNLVRTVAQNQLTVGKGGPVAYGLLLDFTQDSEFTLDLQSEQARGYLDLCQSIYVDNYEGGAALEVYIPSSRWRAVVKAGDQGWFTPICPNPIKIVFRSNGGRAIQVFVDNTAIPGHSWSSI